MAFVKSFLVAFLVMMFTMEAQARGRGSSRNFGCPVNNDVNKNITALWDRVQFLSQPIEVHVHEDNRKCDDYFGCDFMEHHGHDSKHGHHSNHSSHAHGKGKGHDHKHGSHKHGSHKHGSHKHASHKHGSHKHASHGHGSHAPDFKDNHIHIHLSVNNKDDCGFVSYAPKDEFVYARCDMVAEKKSRIKGSLFMRQKPHGVLETKINLRGFKGPSEGIKDGKHDFFYDVHKMADFSDGCKSFGEHDHVHHSNGGFDHEHEHKHEDDQEHGGHSHNHGHRDGHNHSVHDHHAHPDDWGNIVINKMGKVNMEVNCTHHELYGPESMFGRGLVLHDKNDDVVSCCAITYANIDDKAWDKL